MNFKWSNDYNLGLEEVDVQHRRFLSLIEMLYMAEESARIDVLNELNRYATYHFISEEEMMNQYDYGELKTHASEHSFLKGKLVAAINDSKKGILKFESFIMFLIKWFTDHTTVTDRKMSKYIIEKRTSFRIHEIEN